MPDPRAPASAELSRAAAPPRRERLLLVGLAGCDPAVAGRLMQAGRMPNLARLRAAGAWARLDAPEPLLEPAIWTSVATGRQPEAHGVLGPDVPRPDGGGVASPGRAAWRAPALWEVLEAVGRRCIVVNWPATAPATAWPGLHVDARWAPPAGNDFASWPVPRGSASPAALVDRLRELRVHPADIGADMLLPFVPELAGINQYCDVRVAELAAMLAGAATVHAAATALIETEAWDVALVRYGLLARVQRRFAPAGAPWQGVADAAYGFADAMLGRLLELTGDAATVWLVSPAGAGQAGLLVARGRWIAADALLPPLRVVDVMPTLLARFGLVSETDGQVVRALAPGASRRAVPVPPATAEPDRHVAALRALGYDDATTPAQAAALARAETERLLVLGEALLARGRVTEAESSLRTARARLPDSDPAGLQRLALCCLARDDAAGCREVGRQLRAAMPQHPWGDLAIAAGHALTGDAPAAWRHMARAEQVGGHDPLVLVRLGGIALLLREDLSARDSFARALRLAPGLDAAAQGLAMARQLSAAYDSERRLPPGAPGG